MNSVPADFASTVGVAPATSACFHCGEALPANPASSRIDGTERSFCCTGCAAAAAWIRDARLDDYYRLRSAPAARVAADDVDLAQWDREDILAEHARAVPGGRELTLLTNGMRCAACAWLIDRALTREPGVIEVSANAVTGRIRIAWDPACIPLSTALRRLQSLGYRPWLATGEANERMRRRERNRALLRLGVAGLGAMQAMMFAEALYLDPHGSMSPAMRDFFRWITFLVSTPVVFYAGWPFLAGGWRELRHRSLGMDTLIATSVLLAWGASVVETVRGGTQVWYDAAVMFVFLLLLARMLEQRARNTASAQVDALARARPALAVRERADGSREHVPLTALQADDVVCIASGEHVPADGLLLDPEAGFAEALLTGEPREIGKKAGDAVYAGTICGNRPVRVRVTATGQATRLSQLARLAEQAQSHRPPLARIADRIATWFVLAMLSIAVVVFLAWHVRDPARALEVTLSLLAISCPCALSLAVPAALASANGALAKLGILPVAADALDRLARVDQIVFDKTGTLSDDQPVVDAVSTFAGMDRQTALHIACMLECGGTHPLARAFHDAGTDATPATDITTHPGIGIEGTIDGRRWRIGHATFACAGEDDDAIWLGDGERAAARFTIRERARDDARDALVALERSGVGLHLSSGDSPAAVRRLAARLGIADAHARQTPEDKLAFVRSLQAHGHRVAMVGDGLNDAPVLAGADLSIAVGDGAALAQRSADLVLASSALTRIPAALALARRTRRIIRENFAWAIGYNLLALPLAAAGLVTPWIAALGMSLSSLAVTLNALRLASVRT